jgi:hypothetical protein
MPMPTPMTTVPVLEVMPNELAPVRLGIANLPLTCTMSALCAGQLVLRSAPLAGSHIASAARADAAKRKKPRVMTYGSAQFMLASGASKTLAVPLSAAGKALLKKKHGRAVVWADVQLTGGGTATSTQITLHR